MQMMGRIVRVSEGLKGQIDMTRQGEKGWKGTEIDSDGARDVMGLFWDNARDGK